MRVAKCRRLLREQSGQTLPVVAFLLVGLLALTGLVIDVGRCLVARRLLQASTDAAALAGGSYLPSATAATAAATKYSSVTGQLNTFHYLQNVTMVSGYPKVACLTTLTNEGLACGTSPNGNAIQVRQQVTFPLTMLTLVGLSSITLGAEATASSTGASSKPYNVAIVVDSTGSMNNQDTDSSCSTTRINCALAGVQTLLQTLSPCASNLSTCGTAVNGNVATAVDRVALYTFPGLSSASQAMYDYNCSGTNPQISPYTEAPGTQFGSQLTSSPAYQVLSFTSDYRSSAKGNTLAASSNLVHTTGAVNGCPGLKAVGGEGTYFAGVIYQAAYDLSIAQTNYPGTQGVLVLLSDGDASAPTSPNNAMPNASPTSGTFPSQIKQCQQAIDVAKQAVTKWGLRIYTVAYGANATGCSTDGGALTPCLTMQSIASQPQYFFSDYTSSQGSGNCISASHPTSGLNQIFTQIGNDLSTSRLIPDNTT